MDFTDVCFAGVAGQWELLRSGRVTSVELVGAYLDRVRRLDGRLNAFRSVFAEQARDAAVRADARRAAGEDGPLLGVPVVVKEDTDLAGLPTTMGSDAVTTPAPADAEAVSRLKRAGAVVIGRTRAPELCLWPFTETEHAGATRNPWSLGHSPGGSSGGAAAAVAAGLGAAALGSDGGGSIRFPAAATGLYGLKPQRGRVSLFPHGEVWTGLSVAGPITRTVADAALLLDVLHGPMPGDRHAALPPATTFAQAAATRPGRLRIGVSRRPWPVGGRLDPWVRDAVIGTARLLVDLGHRVELVEPPLVDPTGMFGFGPRYLASAARAAGEVDQPGRLAATTRAVAAFGRVYGDPVVAAARRYGERIEAKVNRVFDEVDLLLSPVTPRPPLRIGELWGKPWLVTLLGAQRFAAYTTLWNLTGNPAASVPAGWTDGGLPLAVQLVGRQHDEATVLAVSAQLEDARPWADARPPTAG
ncbi:MAG TPA: amidase [Pseudonocardiaceae bacterium]|jgi:amidase|nr:amidase [Pseudonocardiaceae bacterium]